MPETTRSSVELRGETVVYERRWSTEATKPRIDVDLEGVTVVLPAGSRVDAESLLAEHAEWVLEKTGEVAAYRERVPDRRFEEGATFPYRGEPREVVVERRSYSVVTDEAFRLAAHHVEQTSIERALETLYRRTAREAFEAAAERYAPRMGVEYERIEVRNQRTKWGSCSPRGTLSLNWRLVMAPADVLEYVVVHELAHLAEPNHSDAFWDLVGEHDPDYEAHARWLDEHGVRLTFSGPDR